MRDLQVVGVSDDGTQVLLAASADASRATHVVALDGRLRAAVKGELTAGAKVESALSPKEIQARLRSGDSLEDVAKAAGVPTSRIVPYAGPVISERERVLDEARAAVPLRDRGATDKSLGAAIDARLPGVTGLKPASVEWSARRREDGSWVIGLTYVARGGARTAEWLWHSATRELRSLNAVASRLTVPDSPGATLRSNGKPARRSTSRAKSVRRGSSAAASATAKRASGKAAGPKSTAKAAAAKRTAATKVAATRTAATKVAATRTAATKVAATRTAATKVAATRTAATKVAATRTAATRGAPTKAATAKAGPTKRRARRAPVVAAPAPATLSSWSDVLFGPGEVNGVAASEDSIANGAAPVAAARGRKRP